MISPLGAAAPDLAPPDLSRRDTTAIELMDDADCDLAALRRTYRQFRTVNALVAGWRQCYAALIRPQLSSVRTSTLLDVGSGGGDLARAFATWAARDGLLLAVTGIDPDERAHAFAVGQPSPPGVTFSRTDTRALVAAGARFDLVTSNHLLHHLDRDGLAGLLEDSRLLARQLVVHNDIRRSRLAYAGYAVLSRPFARRSFVRHDGLLSIRRSYTAEELSAEAPWPWRVRPAAPYRLLLMLDLSATTR